MVSDEAASMASGESRTRIKSACSGCKWPPKCDGQRRYCNRYIELNPSKRSCESFEDKTPPHSSGAVLANLLLPEDSNEGHDSLSIIGNSAPVPGTAAAGNRTGQNDTCIEKGALQVNADQDLEREDCAIVLAYEAVRMLLESRRPLQDPARDLARIRALQNYEADLALLKETQPNVWEKVLCAMPLLAMDDVLGSEELAELYAQLEQSLLEPCEFRYTGSNFNYLNELLQATIPKWEDASLQK
ncbi:hypothetical protein LEL_10994 [Akanthomyces lecanii RCEF 1005]|uniref:Uncharacterized protein n=1 Tax=Akanthomyces lecanii RCEF 1005 TaxID=1081108 RepID=A0A167N6Y2_CORDF|nr:hypothetical protein LEL_10994 [Akanthomyces lecanii RCEF 1005]